MKKIYYEFKYVLFHNIEEAITLANSSEWEIVSFQMAPDAARVGVVFKRLDKRQSR